MTSCPKPIFKKKAEMLFKIFMIFQGVKLSKTKINSKYVKFMKKKKVNDNIIT